MKKMIVALFVATALLFIGISIPLIRGAVPPNDLYGFRTAATLADEAVWYEVNRFGGWSLLVAGIAQLAVLAVIARSRLTPEKMALTGAAVMVVTVIAAAVVTSWYQGSVAP